MALHHVLGGGEAAFFGDSVVGLVFGLLGGEFGDVVSRHFGGGVECGWFGFGFGFG